MTISKRKKLNLDPLKQLFSDIITAYPMSKLASAYVRSDKLINTLLCKLRPGIFSDS